MAHSDPRDRRIAELEAALAAALERLERAEARAAKAEARVAELERRLRQNSTNSSRPPSSDPPGTKRPDKPKSGRKPGGQPGHERHERPLVPPEQVDERRDAYPEQCQNCWSHNIKPGDDAEHQPVRHQTVDIPPIKAHVTETTRHWCFCGDCRKWSCAPLPDGTPSGSFGPRLLAVIALCTGVYRLSKRMTAGLLEDLLGVSISTGAISNAEQMVSTALEKPVAEACAYVPHQEVVHQDETGWAENHRKAWLWVAVTTWVTVFKIAATRGADIAKQMLGEDFRGTLVSDRWTGYGWVDADRRQLCWAHIIRNLQELLELGGQATDFAGAMLRKAKKMFAWYHRVRDGTLTRERFERRMARIEREVADLLRTGASSRNARVKSFCHELRKVEPALWTFVHMPDVPPTNNAAEQAIRHGVILRKLCFGTHSAAGSRYVERILTTHATLRKQGRHILDYLTLAVTAHFNHHDAPTLLPTDPAQPVAAAA